MNARHVTGVVLLGAADVASATAALLLPLWLVRLYAPAAGFGSALAIGPAVVLVAIAVCQPAARAVVMLVGVAGALVVCALAWPLPAWSWLAFFTASAVAGVAGRRLVDIRTARVGGFALTLAVAGLVIVRDTVTLDATGQASVQWTLQVIVLAGACLLIARTVLSLVGQRPSPALDRLSAWLNERMLRGLSRRGLVPLDCAQAPVLYRRVDERPDGGWEWEVRDGQTVVASGRASRRWQAHREANHACWARTFSPPTARRPGAMYVLAPVGGNPFIVRAVDIAEPQ